MSDKTKFPLKLAAALAEKIVDALKPACDRILIAGSVRRKRPLVGDIEIVFIPKLALVTDPSDLFKEKKIQVNAVDLVLAKLIEDGSLAKRKSVLGREAWGEDNKLAVAIKTGIAVDFFTATPENWWNYLVCRTGSAETNRRIAEAAIRRGCRWCPTREGFLQERGSGNVMYKMTSEQDVFIFVGLPYLEPEQR